MSWASCCRVSRVRDAFGAMAFIKIRAAGSSGGAIIATSVDSYRHHEHAPTTPRRAGRRAAAEQDQNQEADARPAGHRQDADRAVQRETARPGPARETAGRS